MNYFRIGISTFIYLIPIAVAFFCMFTAIKFLLKRKIEFKPQNMLCEFAWILTVLAILEITGVNGGIVGGNFGITSLFDGNVNFSFSLFEEGFSMATLLNIVLFIPFGFFSPIIFRKLQNKWGYGILIGLIFSITIEFFQTFIGRFVQLNDILTNTFGTFLGYEVFVLLLKLKSKTKNGMLLIDSEYEHFL